MVNVVVQYCSEARVELFGLVGASLSGRAQNLPVHVRACSPHMYTHAVVTGHLSDGTVFSKNAKTKSQKQSHTKILCVVQKNPSCLCQFGFDFLQQHRANHNLFAIYDNFRLSIFVDGDGRQNGDAIARCLTAKANGNLSFF